jgi:hypothetical protein
VGVPVLEPRSAGSFGAFFSGRRLAVRIEASTDGERYRLPVTIADSGAGRVTNTVIELPLLVDGTPETAGVKEGRTRIADVFGVGGADVVIPWRFEQLDGPLRMDPLRIEGGADVPLIAGDTTGTTGILRADPQTCGEREVVIEFGAGGLDTLSLVFGRIFPYLTVTVRDAGTNGILVSGRDYRWTGAGIRQTTTAAVRENRYYLTGTTPTGQVWEFGHLFTHYNSALAMDYPDRGRGSSSGPPYFAWASGGRRGTRDFVAGDRVRVKWQGGVRGEFPDTAVVELVGEAVARGEVTQGMLEQVRVVPNPYVVRHGAQRGVPVVSFTNLPSECTIRIYTVALDLVAVLEHRGGSRREWDLLTEGGQLVASQLLLALVETPNGLSVTRKFAVIVAR